MTAARGRGKPRKLSAEQEAMVATLRRAGFGIAAVSAVFDIGPRTMHAILRRQGVETTRGRRRLTAEQEDELVDLARAGWSQRKLAAHFKISIDTVRATKRRDRAVNSTSYGTE